MASTVKLLGSFTRLSLQESLIQRSISTAAAPLCFRLTQVAEAEPLKKKKKMDPMLVRQREERKKKKIEKQIRRLEKNASQLKPIDELEVPRVILQEKEIRKRSIQPQEDVNDQRVALLKEWSQYKYQQHLAETTMIDEIMASQQHALEELRKVSEDLWLEAIQLDQTLLPYRAKGPLGTPPIPDYDTPDGEYFNKTKKWD
ncbi:39S ribosomal protein L40, mitochondrial-like [Penaeus japonicus]|uniref:39S ribosomal protein L40, mitochondrial-like n=1 Tax=Penaeus japonicus TaxID=27405 RepID=UPI001C71672B|nr:39S ribosomal protein L40, mitochondrial-like [Penaeus japonicus]